MLIELKYGIKKKKLKFEYVIDNIRCSHSKCHSLMDCKVSSFLKRGYEINQIAHDNIDETSFVSVLFNIVR